MLIEIINLRFCLYDNEQLIKLVNFTKQKIIEIGKINNGDFRIDPIKNTNFWIIVHIKLFVVLKNTKIGHYLKI